VGQGGEGVQIWVVGQDQALEVGGEGVEGAVVRQLAAAEGEVCQVTQRGEGQEGGMREARGDPTDGEVLQLL
jgi:hypothetical protein